MSRSNLNVRSDPRDPRYALLELGGDYPPLRLSLANSKQLVATLGKLIPEQERHTAGARIVLPVKVERLA